MKDQQPRFKVTIVKKYGVIVYAENEREVKAIVHKHLYPMQNGILHDVHYVIEKKEFTSDCPLRSDHTDSDQILSDYAI